MPAEGLSLDAVVYVVGWALLHSLWQGAAVALAAMALLRLLRQGSSSLRYAVSYVGLLLTFLLPVWTAWRLALAPGLPGTPGGSAPGPAAARAALEGTSVVVTLGAPPRFWTAVAWPLLEALLPWIVAGWTLGVLLHSVRLAGGYIQVVRLRRQGSPVPEPWQEAFAGLVRRLRVSAPVRLLASTKILVPMACGWLRPVVIVPASTFTAIPVAQLESILAHELAHIRRHDYLLNLVQSVIEILLFYHPGARWLSAQAHAERENCCDDIAVAACGDPGTYARALAGLEHLRVAALPAVALPATGGALLQRIRRLIAPPAAPADDLGSRLTAAVLLLGAMSLAGLTVAARAQLHAENIDNAAAPLPAALQELVYSPAEEARLEEACGDSGQLRRCADADAAVIRLECVPSSPLALLLWSLGERPQQDDLRVPVRERRAARPGLPPEAADPGGPVQRSRQVQVLPSDPLPRCGT